MYVMTHMSQQQEMVSQMRRLVSLRHTREGRRGSPSTNRARVSTGRRCQAKGEGAESARRACNMSAAATHDWSERQAGMAKLKMFKPTPIAKYTSVPFMIAPISHCGQQVCARKRGWEKIIRCLVRRGGDAFASGDAGAEGSGDRCRAGQPRCARRMRTLGGDGRRVARRGAHSRTELERHSKRGDSFIRSHLYVLHSHHRQRHEHRA